MRKYLLVILPWLMVLFTETQAKCSYPVDTLYFESFEDEFPSAWTFYPNNDREKWMLDAGGFASFKNPGEANWVYLDDHGRKNSDLAQIETGFYDLSAHKAFAELSFLLNFQEFDKHGNVILEMYSRGEWVKIFETDRDFEGKIIIDIRELVGTRNKFRFSYSDGGVDGWGVGIDNFLISGSSSICGNDICEFGEDPSTCPGDCPKLEDYPATWISEDENMQGESVSFQNFPGNGTCDDCSYELDFDFDFQFYGSTYSHLFINSNGNVSFKEDFVNFVPQEFCLKGAEIIAPFFSDVDLSKGGEISYYKDPQNHYVLVYWKNVAFFGCNQDCEQRNSYQLLLTDGSVQKYGGVNLPTGTNVVFSYGDMQWTGGAASGGYLGFGGNAATVGINSGEAEDCEDYGTFANPGYVFLGNDKLINCVSSGVDHLDFKYLFFNAAKGAIAEYKGISSFKGVYDGKGVVLDWEIDVLDEEGLFVIERMLLGDEYPQYQELAILHIEDQHAKSQEHSFSFTDENIPEGTYSYRIHYLQGSAVNYQDSIQVESFNQVQFVDTSRNFAIISYGPNPMQEALSVVLAPNLKEEDEETEIVYTLLDMTGNEYMRGNLTLYEGNSSFAIETHDLPAGLYILNIASQKDKQYIRLAKN